MRAVALSLLLSIVTAVSAVDVRIQLPDPIIPGVALDGQIVITDPPGSVQDIRIDGTTPGLKLELRLNRRQTSNINGRTTMAYGLRVSASQTGQFETPPVVISFSDGSQVTSQPTSLKVWGQQPWLEGNAVVRASFVPDTIVPGQDAQLRWQVCAPIDLDLEAEPGKHPRIPDALIPRGEPEMLGNGVGQDTKGEYWQIVTYALDVTCSTPGTYRADGQLQIGRLSGWSVLNQSFRAMFTEPIQPATLTVAALPMEGRPDDFTGLVGEITIHSELERDSIVLGEGTRLTIEIRGPQVDYTTRPHVQTSPGLRLRPLDDSSGPGWQRFTWNVEPERSGEFSLEAISLPWFDPQQGRYHRSSGPALTLNVLPGQRRQATVVGQVDQSPTASTPLVVAPTMPAPLHGAAWTKPAPALGWWALVGGVLAGLAIGFGLRFTTGPRTVDHAAELRRAAAGNDLARIDRALHAVQANCTDPALRSELTNMMTTLERARFGGGAIDDSLRQRLRTWGQA